MNEKLKSIYYNPKHPAGFASISKLSKASGIGKAKVEKWLQKQSTYTLHRMAKKKYPTRKYTVHDIDLQWQADLADVSLISRYNKGYNFLLTVIDIFTRYAWARPLKTKRGKEVAEAFKDIFREGRIPKRVQTDQGKEFENKEVKSLFRQHDIELFSVKSAYKAAIVERFNRTLKSRLWKYFTMTLKQKWTDVLQDTVHAYNHSKHRTLGMRPVDVNDGNVDDVRQIWSSGRPSTARSAFKVGDLVRISKMKSVFAKGYLPNWTEELFTISSINRKKSPIMYKLKDYSGEEIEGSFYRYEIQKVQREEDKFLVEKIVKTQKRGSQKWYFVKWLGYPASMNSWVRQSDMSKLNERGTL